jgi:mannose-6-phosphate isomerase-like protein (cupin superfamily)
MHQQPFMSALLLTIVCGTAVAQQPADAYDAGATKGHEKGTKLSVAERMRRRPDILTNDAVSDVASEFDAQKKTLGETVLMSSDEKTFYLFVHRTENSRPEVHARWDDLVIVKSGTGAIEMGDSLIGSEFRAAGERIGGKFHRSYRVVVRAGDIVRIPAVVPHAFVVSGKEPLDYLVIKQRREGLPIHWEKARQAENRPSPISLRSPH